MGSRWNIVLAVQLKKTWMKPLSESQKNLTICAFILTQYYNVTDSRIDRW